MKFEFLTGSPDQGPDFKNHYPVHNKCLCFLPIFSRRESCSSVLSSQHRQGYPCRSVTDKALQSTWRHYFFFPPKESVFYLGVKSEAMGFNYDPFIQHYVKFCRLLYLYITCLVVIVTSILYGFCEKKMLSYLQATQWIAWCSKCPRNVCPC